MKSLAMNEKELEYGQFLQAAINAVRKTIPAAIAAEYDMAPEPWEDNHTIELARIVGTLRELHTDLYTYHDPKAKKDKVFKSDEEEK